MNDLKTLLTDDEWELLCDNCGLCCLFKVRDEDTGEIFYTSVVCPLLDREKRRCKCYPERFKKMPTCTKVSPESLPEIVSWMPKSCAYRCLYEGISLPDWHPIFRDPSPEAGALLEKIEKICIRPNSFITEKTVSFIMQNSKAPHSPHKLTRLLLANVIENMDI